MDRSVIADIPRDKYVERCKQRAFDYLDRGDFKNAVSSFVNVLLERLHRRALVGGGELGKRKRRRKCRQV